MSILSNRDWLYAASLGLVLRAFATTSESDIRDRVAMCKTVDNLDERGWA